MKLHEMKKIWIKSIFVGLLSITLSHMYFNNEVYGKSLKGLVVEEVKPGGVGKKAGVIPGDRILSWTRLPNLPANPKKASGEIKTIFDWIYMEHSKQFTGFLAACAKLQNGRWLDINVIQAGEDKQFTVELFEKIAQNAIIVPPGRVPTI